MTFADIEYALANRFTRSRVVDENALTCSTDRTEQDSEELMTSWCARAIACSLVKGREDAMDTAHPVRSVRIARHVNSFQP